MSATTNGPMATSVWPPTRDLHYLLTMITIFTCSHGAFPIINPGSPDGLFLFGNFPVSVIAKPTPAQNHSHAAINYHRGAMP